MVRKIKKIRILIDLKCFSRHLLLLGGGENYGVLGVMHDHVLGRVTMRDERVLVAGEDDAARGTVVSAVAVATILAVCGGVVEERACAAARQAHVEHRARRVAPVSAERQQGLAHDDRRGPFVLHSDVETEQPPLEAVGVRRR